MTTRGERKTLSTWAGQWYRGSITPSTAAGFTVVTMVIRCHASGIFQYTLAEGGFSNQEMGTCGLVLNHAEFSSTR